MKEGIHEIPDRLKPFIRHARHHSPDGSVVEYHGTRAPKDPNGSQPEGNEVKEYIESIKRAKGLQSTDQNE